MKGIALTSALAVMLACYFSPALKVVADPGKIPDDDYPCDFLPPAPKATTNSNKNPKEAHPNDLPPPASKVAGDSNKNPKADHPHDSLTPAPKAAVNPNRNPNAVHPRDSLPPAPKVAENPSRNPNAVHPRDSLPPAPKVAENPSKNLKDNYPCNYCNPSATKLFYVIAENYGCIGENLKKATEAAQVAFKRLCSYAWPTVSGDECVNTVRVMDNGITNRTLEMLFQNCGPPLNAEAVYSRAYMVLNTAYRECCVYDNDIDSFVRPRNTAFLEEKHILHEPCIFVNSTTRRYTCRT